MIVTIITIPDLSMSLRRISTCVSCNNIYTQPQTLIVHCVQLWKVIIIIIGCYYRCGGLYCGTHRYAKTHSCTFDYKTKGKETIARNNPLVVATKLPKI